MTQVPDVRQLDVRALARAGAGLAGEIDLAVLERLAEQITSHHHRPSNTGVAWRLQAEQRSQTGASAQVWLDLDASARATLVCQRCLEPVSIDLNVHRRYRFVASDALAEAEDLESEEDVLSLARPLDLHELLEDELLMAIPMVPMHDVCAHTQSDVLSNGSDPDASTSASRRSFAVLASLKRQ